MDFKDLIAKAKADGKLTEEQAKLASDVFGIDSLTKLIADSTEAEVTTRFNARKTELEANWEKANAEYIAMQEDVSSTKADLEKAKADLLAATEKLKTANPNIDIAKLTEDITKVVTERAASLELGARAMELDAIDCAEEHQRLFGQRVSPKQLAMDALAAKKPVLDYWNEKYNVTAKREELSKAAHDKEIADAVERGRKEALAETAHPGMRTLAESKSPFWVPKDATAKEGMNPWDEQGPPPEEQALLQELSGARG